MPKTNANDMVMAWLDMKIHENPDSFDAINAENCLALIRKQRKQLISLGAHFCNLKKQMDKLRQQITIAEKHAYSAERHLNDACKTVTQEPVPWWADVPYGMLRPTCCETQLDMSKE